MKIMNFILRLLGYSSLTDVILTLKKILICMLEACSF